MTIQKKQLDSNQKVMKQFLALPVVLGALLIATGSFGIYVSKHSNSQLVLLNDAALGPTLAFDEIVANLNVLNQNLLRVNQAGIAQADQEKVLKKSKLVLKKIGKQVNAQIEASKGLAFESYLGKWVSDWNTFQSTLEPKLDDVKVVKASISATDSSIGDLIEKMGNVNTFIQSDVKDMLESGTHFSKKASLYHILILFGGVLIGLVSSILIVRSIRNLFIQIAEGKKNIETLLNNLDQGFLVFDKNGKIQEGVSKAAKTFFGQDPTNHVFTDIVPTDEKGNSAIQAWHGLIYGGGLRFVDFEPLAPQSFEQGDHFIKLDFRPIYKDGNEDNLDKVICIASDKTEEKRLREKAESEAALVKLVMTVLSDRGSFVDFVLESRKNIVDLKNELAKFAPSLDVLFRGMHSVKGGSAAFSMMAVSRRAHELENKLADIRVEGGQSLPAFIPTLKEGVVAVEKLFEEFLVKHESILGKIGDQEDRTRIVPVHTIFQLSQMILKQIGREHQVFQQYVEHFVQEDLGSAFKRYESVVKGVAERQMKSVDFQIETGKVRVFMDPYASLINTYIHAFRNAIDHGIEDEVTRSEIGKPETGSIKVKFERSPGKVIEGICQENLKIIVEDDGKGIDPAIIRQKAIEKKVASEAEINKMTDQAVIQLLFHNGFSTAEAVSDLSGRGVGTDAIRFEAEKLQGKAWIESEKGKGTRFIVEVPLYDSPIPVHQHADEIRAA